MRKLITLLSALFLLLAAGCGGGSSGGGSDDPGGSNTQTISGIVTDPAITGAQVEIRKISDDTIVNTCGVAGNLLCRRFTNDAGVFSFVVPSSFDFSLYYIETHGGVDTETGISFESISLRAPLNAFSGNADGIVVSPLTSLITSNLSSVTSRMSQSEIQSAVNAVRAAFGFAADVDILSDPSLEPELLHASYLLVKIAVQYRDFSSTYGGGEENPFDAISRAIENGDFVSPGGVFAAGALDAVFAEFTSASSYAEVKQELEETLAILAGLSGEGDIIAELVAAEKSAIFRRTVSSLVTNLPATVSDTYTANVDKLLAGLENTSGVSFSLESFPIYQAVRFALFNNSFFVDYNNYISGDFDAELASLLSANGFASALSTIMSESGVQFVNVPLAAANLPGDNNTARANYYFSSNIDQNYKARKLINKVFDDEINDYIYLKVIESYASMGLLDKAKKLTDAFLVKSISKSEAYMYLGKYTSVYGNDSAAFTFLQTSESFFRLIYEARGDNIPTAAEILLVSNIAQEFTPIGRSDETERLTAWLKTQVDNISVEATKRTGYTRLLNAQKTVVESHIADGDLAKAEAAADYMFVLLEDMPLMTTGTNGKYATHYSYYRNAFDYYRTLGLKAKTVQYYNDKYEPKRLVDVGDGRTFWQNSTAYIIVNLYWAGGKDTATSILGTITTASSKKNAAKGIGFIKALEEDFASAVSFYEAAIPIGSDFTSIGDYIDSWLYLGINKSNPGIALSAIEAGDTELAVAALEYIEGKFDALKAYIDTNSLSYNTYINSLAGNYSSSGYDTYAYEGGYLKLAELYMDLGNTVKAAAMVDKAYAYVDGCVDSVAKANAYSAAARYYLELGNTAKANEVYAKNLLIDTSSYPAIDKFDYYRILAKDKLMTGDTEAAEELIDTSITYGLGIHPTGTVDNTLASKEVIALNMMASLYNDLQKVEKAKNVLELSAATAKEITTASGRKNHYEYVIGKYSDFGLVELAYEKARELFETTADLNSAIEDIAYAVANHDDFPDSSIAFVDTDKDGKPDFFLPSATPEQIAASGLVLDDDSDGDGKPDTTDTTPFYAD